MLDHLSASKRTNAEILRLNLPEESGNYLSFDDLIPLRNETTNLHLCIHYIENRLSEIPSLGSREYEEEEVPQGSPGQGTKFENNVNVLVNYQRPEKIHIDAFFRTT